MHTRTALRPRNTTLTIKELNLIFLLKSHSPCPSIWPNDVNIWCGELPSQFRWKCLRSDSSYALICLKLVDIHATHCPSLFLLSGTHCWFCLSVQTTSTFLIWNHLRQQWQWDLWSVVSGNSKSWNIVHIFSKVWSFSHFTFRSNAHLSQKPIHHPYLQVHRTIAAHLWTELFKGHGFSALPMMMRLHLSGPSRFTHSRAGNHSFYLLLPSVHLMSAVCQATSGKTNSPHLYSTYHTSSTALSAAASALGQYRSQWV